MMSHSVGTRVSVPTYFCEGSLCCSDILPAISASSTPAKFVYTTIIIIPFSVYSNMDVAKNEHTNEKQ